MLRKILILWFIAAWMGLSIAHSAPLSFTRDLKLSEPGRMVSLSPAYSPPVHDGPIKGGIDLQTVEAGLKIQKEGGRLSMSVNPAMLKDFQERGIEELRPLIYGVFSIDFAQWLANVPVKKVK